MEYDLKIAWTLKKTNACYPNKKKVAENIKRNFPNTLFLLLRSFASCFLLAIESYHCSSYRIIPKRKALGSSLRFLFQVCEKDPRLLRNYYQFALAPSHGSKKKKIAKRRK